MWRPVAGREPKNRHNRPRCVGSGRRFERLASRNIGMKLTRRSVLRATAATLAAPALGALGAGPAAAQSSNLAKNWKHGLSLFGQLKYPEGFKNFDYVNPAAPQGGTVRQIAFGTFDNFNSVVSGVKGSIALGTELFMETLMT